MEIARRLSLLVTASLLGLAIMLGWVSARPTASANAVHRLSEANTYFDSTIVLARAARPRGDRGDQLAVTLGYAERLRLGLGSPFKLVDEALSDPRLDDSASTKTAWGILGRLQRGDAYVIDPIVLEGLGPWSSDGQGASGAAHLGLIESTIRTASDPRAGELAIRLAYQIEAAKGTLSSSAFGIATQVAALIRDREASESDLRDLLADANQGHVAVMDLLHDRRTAHAFRVEQPLLMPTPRDLQKEAMAAVPSLVRALDTLDRVSSHAASNARAPNATMGPYFAARVSALGDERPPVSQIAVTLSSQTRSSMHATNDESLAGEYDIAMFEARTDSARRSLTLAMMTSAVAMRALSQDTPWFPGDGGISIGQLTADFGLGDVTFVRGVPNAWRPYYVTELYSALSDLRNVFPGLLLNGLKVRIGDAPLADSALAMHDPRSRTLQLSIASSGGTIAHEIAHDLDWQTSRTLFAGARGYSTDRAVRERKGPLARSLLGLAEARLLRPVNASAQQAAVGRPTELFARGTDWFVASTLAQQGRMNGFLSDIQDEVIAGYAAGAPTAVGTAGSQSLLNALETMTYLPDSVVAGFEAQWADPANVDPTLLVRRALETPIPFRSNGQLHALRSTVAAAASLPPAAARICVASDDPEMHERANLLMLAVDARARGIARRRARYRPSMLGNSEWANSVLARPPWSREDGERLIESLRASIVNELTAALPDQGVLPVVPAIFRSSDASCSSIAR